MATATHFWHFEYNGQDASNINNVPTIVPGSPSAPPVSAGTPVSRESSPDIQPAMAGTPAKSSVDVVNDFPWTKHGVGARSKVPQIVLKEKNIQTSPYVTTLINSALDSVGAVSDTAVQAGGIAVSLSSAANVNTSSSNVNAVANGAISGTAAAIGKVSSGIQAAISSLAERLDSVGSAYDAPSSNFLKTYQGLYILKPSGFIYTFPLGSEALSMSNHNAFGESTETGTTFAGGDGGAANPFTLLAGIKGAVSEVAKNIQQVGGILQPGSYFEKSKFFDMPKDGDSWDIDFTLSNVGDGKTSSAETISRNFNLIFLLLYQNTPGRRSRSLIDPPAMYEVFIDGVNYAPYAVFKEINITPLGRIITKTIPFPQNKNVRGGSFGTISTAIPEAYRVRITVQSLHARTRNFILAGLEGSGRPSRTVSVSDILKK